MKQVYKVLALLVVVSGAATAQTEVLEQWGLAVSQASTYTITTLGFPDQILGPANSNCEPETSDFAGLSWRTREPDAGEEWIEVRFAQPVYATAVEVYETLNPGAVTSVKVPFLLLR